MRGPQVGRVVWDRLVALLLLAFAVYVVAEARQLAYLQGRVPGPGFAPFWIGVGLGLTALAILAGTWRAPPSDALPEAPRSEEQGPPPARPWVLLAVGAAMVGAAALAERLGMVAALALLLLAAVRILGGSWRHTALTAVALPVLFYLLFGLWLKVPLPRGPWGF